MIALVTCNAARGVDTDLPLLLAEMPDAVVVDWDQPEVDWATFERVIIRSTWDYHVRRQEFLTWVDHVSAVSALWNDAELLRWNTDKRYLGDLERAGVPIVPMSLLSDVAAVDHQHSVGGFDGDIVVKPTVGASASGVLAVRDAPDVADRHARSLVAAGLVAMVQPYLGGVDEHGETGLVYLGGEFSHAVRRRVVLRPPAALDAGDDVLGNEHSSARAPSDNERAVGEAVMAELPPTAYARVDLLPGPNGPVVLEVEVTEPSLFLHLDATAPARAAAAFRNL